MINYAHLHFETQASRIQVLSRPDAALLYTVIKREPVMVYGRRSFQCGVSIVPCKEEEAGGHPSRY